MWMAILNNRKHKSKLSFISDTLAIYITQSGAGVFVWLDPPTTLNGDFAYAVPKSQPLLLLLLLLLRAETRTMESKTFLEEEEENCLFL